MRKWLACAGVSLVIVLLAELAYAQNGPAPTDPKSPANAVAPGPRDPGMGGPGFGPGRRMGQRFGFNGGPNFPGGQTGQPPGFDGRMGRRFGFRGAQGFAGRPRFSETPSVPTAPVFVPAPQPSQQVAPPPAPAPSATVMHHFAFREHLAALYHHVGPLGALLILIVAVPVLLVLFWVLPISLGVCIARRRNLSPLWMLFGIHPLGGWIACLVLALSKGKASCPACGGYIRRNFRQCPFCHGAVPGPTPATPPTQA